MEEATFYLNLNDVNLRGHEREKSDLVIDSIVRGIEAGDEFPAVNVIKLSETEFELTDGHNRALGHYIANKPLKCRLSMREPTPLLTHHIRDMILADDHGEYVTKKIVYPDYR